MLSNFATKRVNHLARHLTAGSYEYASSCYFPTDWVDAPLVSKIKYNHDSDIFEFGLPEGRSLDLPVCACILAKGPNDEKGEPIVRPYTPMSDNSMTGKFQLLVKNYPESGTMSKHLHSLPIGTMVPFKHIAFNIKIQYVVACLSLRPDSWICWLAGIPFLSSRPSP